MQNLNSKSANLADRSYKFSLEIILLAPLISSVPGFRPLSDQLFRSGTSIGANIAEAKSASSRIEFKKFQEIALKSANETTYWLNLAKDSGKFKQQENTIIRLIDECSQLSRMLAAGIIKLKSQRL